MSRASRPPKRSGCRPGCLAVVLLLVAGLFIAHFIAATFYTKMVEDFRDEMVEAGDVERLEWEGLSVTVYPTQAVLVFRNPTAIVPTDTGPLTLQARRITARVRPIYLMEPLRIHAHADRLQGSIDVDRVILDQVEADLRLDVIDEPELAVGTLRIHAASGTAAILSGGQAERALWAGLLLRQLEAQADFTRGDIQVRELVADSNVGHVAASGAIALEYLTEQSTLNLEARLTLPDNWIIRTLLTIVAPEENLHALAGLYLISGTLEDPILTKIGE